VKPIVHFRQDAETDVADAAAWYENQSAGLGAEFLDEILATCNNQSAGLGAEFLDEILATCNIIAENPQMYPVLHRGTRRAIIQKFPFGVYYRVENDLVTLIGVMHASRDPNQWKKRT
jgi:plasmid stabilization system protein ParE